MADIVWSLCKPSSDTLASAVVSQSKLGRLSHHARDYMQITEEWTEFFYTQNYSVWAKIFCNITESGFFLIFSIQSFCSLFEVSLSVKCQMWDTCQFYYLFVGLFAWMSIAFWVLVYMIFEFVLQGALSLFVCYYVALFYLFHLFSCISLFIAIMLDVIY